MTEQSIFSYRKNFLNREERFTDPTRGEPLGGDTNQQVFKIERGWSYSGRGGKPAGTQRAEAGDESGITALFQLFGQGVILQKVAF